MLMLALGLWIFLFQACIFVCVTLGFSLSFPNLRAVEPCGQVAYFDDESFPGS